MTDQVSPEGVATPAIGATVTETPPAQDTAAKPPVTPAESPPAVEAPKEPKGVQKRLDELTRNWREAQRQNERLLALLEQRGKTTPQEQPKAQPKTFKDFGYDENAYREYLHQEARAEAAKAAKEEASKWRQEQEAQQRRAKFDERAAKFAATNPEYAEVISGAWDCSQSMAEAIEDSEEGPAIAFYLAQNPEIASQLSRLGPVQSGREIDRIERKLVEERKKAAEKPVSQAPPPPPKIEGSNPGNVENDPSKMTDDQFRKWREKTIARRGGR